MTGADQVAVLAAYMALCGLSGVVMLTPRISGYLARMAQHKREGWL